MTVFIPVHDMLVFSAGFMTMFFIALFVFIFSDKRDDNDSNLY